MSLRRRFDFIRLPRAASSAAPSVLTAVVHALTEWLFAMSPLIVVAIVMGVIGEFSRLFSSAEWSFGASVLGGQALVKFAVGLSRPRRAIEDRVLLGASTLLVLCVIPANVVLALVISAEARGQHIGMTVSIFQVLIFAVASILFVLVSAMAHMASIGAGHRPPSAGDGSA